MKSARFCCDPQFARRCLAIDDHLATIGEFKRENAAIGLGIYVCIDRFQRGFDIAQYSIDALMKLTLLLCHTAVHTRDTILSISF